MSTRILLDCRMAYWSGVGRYTRGLVRGLAEQPGLDLVLVGRTGDATVLPDSEHVTNVSASAGPLGFAGMRELGSIAEHQRPDLIHCLHFPTPWAVQDPLVVTLHDLTPLVVPGAMRSPLHRVTYRALNRRAVRLASRIITPSGASAHDILKLFPRSAGKTVAIAEAADDFSAGEVGTIPQGVVPRGEPYILTMGNTKTHKDLPTLLDAFQRIAPSRPRLHLVLVGDEPRGYLDERLKGESRNRAHFTGSVDDAELRALYASAQVFAFPSLYEGFGLPPLEAMSFGAPVVAARAGSIPEVVGDAALLVKPGDARALLGALARVLDDAAVRDEMRAKGRARAKEFTWARAARQTAEVYAEVLGG